jgi:hypothetical protein
LQLKTREKDGKINLQGGVFKQHTPYEKFTDVRSNAGVFPIELSSLPLFSLPYILPFSGASCFLLLGAQAD